MPSPIIIPDNFLTIVDQRMFHVAEILLEEGTINTKVQFQQAMGGMAKQNWGKIRQGKMSFTVSHIFSICQCFGINANYIFGTEDNIKLKKRNYLISTRNRIVVN